MKAMRNRTKPTHYVTDVHPRRGMLILFYATGAWVILLSAFVVLTLTVDAMGVCQRTQSEGVCIHTIR